MCERDSGGAAQHHTYHNHSTHFIAHFEGGSAYYQSIVSTGGGEIRAVVIIH